MVKVRYLATFWLATNRKKEEEVNLAKEATLKDLFNDLILRYKDEFKKRLFLDEGILKPVWITVNGKQVTSLDTKLSENDKITIGGVMTGG